MTAFTRSKGMNATNPERTAVFHPRFPLNFHHIIPIISMITAPRIAIKVYVSLLYFFPLIRPITIEAMMKENVYPPNTPNRYPSPEPPPMKTGTPMAPRIIHRAIIIVESLRSNIRAIRKIIKFKSVMCAALGSGVGILRYADTHSIAVNIAIMTNSTVVNGFFMSLYSS